MPPAAGGARHLGADEPGADDQQRFRPLQRRPQRERVVEGAQGVHVRRLAGQCARDQPGGDDDRVAVQRRTVGQLQLVAGAGAQGHRRGCRGGCAHRGRRARRVRHSMARSGSHSPVSTCLDSGGRSYGGCGSAPTRLIRPWNPAERSCSAVRSPPSPAPTTSDVLRLTASLSADILSDGSADAGLGVQLACAAGRGSARAAATRASGRCRPRSAIWVWVMLPKNRSSTIVRSRSASSASTGRSACRKSTRSSSASASPTSSPTVALPCSEESISSSDELRYASDASSPSSTSATGHARAARRSRWASGARPRLCDSSDTAAVDRDVQVLEPPRHPHRPAEVAEVPADLAADGGHREGEEVGAAVGGVPVDRVDQPDRRDLDEVVERLAAVGEAAGDVLGHRQEPAYELVAQPLPVRVVRVERRVALEQGDEVAVLGVGAASPQQRRRRACPAGCPTVGADAVAAGVVVHGRPRRRGSAAPASRTCRWRRRRRRARSAPAACTSMRSGRTRNVQRSHDVGAATSTSVAQASSTAIRRSEMASRSKSARAARSEATARIVGISAALADVRTSTVDAPSSVVGGRGGVQVGHAAGSPSGLLRCGYRTCGFILLPGH